MREQFHMSFMKEQFNFENLFFKEAKKKSFKKIKNRI